MPRQLMPVVMAPPVLAQPAPPSDRTPDSEGHPRSFAVEALSQKSQTRSATGLPRRRPVALRDTIKMIGDLGYPAEQEPRVNTIDRR